MEDKVLNKLNTLEGEGATIFDAIETDYAGKLNDIELKNLQEDLNGKKQDREQRGKFANRTFNLMCYYLGAVMIIVILKGAKVLALSDSVVNVLLTTTTANIIGIFMIVAKYLFYRQSQQNARGKVNG